MRTRAMAWIPLIAFGGTLAFMPSIAAQQTGAGQTAARQTAAVPAVARGGPGAWTGTSEQKIMGLMSIWAEAKFAFPWFDELPGLDWDAKAAEFLPRAAAAPDIESYYRLLAEFATLLKDGHTLVRPPWFPFHPGDDFPAVELQIVEGRFLVARAGSGQEISSQGIHPGLEILEAEGLPIAGYFRERVLRFATAGSEHGDRIQVWSIFLGPRDGKVALKVREPEGTVREATLTRNAMGSGSGFFPRFAQWNGFDRQLDSRSLPGGLLYVRIPTFMAPAIGHEFEAMLSALDLTAVRGMIIDLRYNSGGSSTVMDRIAAALTNRPLSSPIMRYPQYVAAWRAWGKAPAFLEAKNTTQPSRGKRYLGPLVILTGNGTASTAEDFAIEMRHAGRALLVGERTAGSAGNPLEIALPGGGSFEVSTFRAYLPDGGRYVHIGVPPDIEATATQRDLVEGREPILEKGIEVLLDWDAHSGKLRKP